MHHFWARFFWFLFVLFNGCMLLMALFTVMPMVTQWGDVPDIDRMHSKLLSANIELWAWGDIIIGMPAILQYLRSK